MPKTYKAGNNRLTGHELLVCKACGCLQEQSTGPMTDCRCGGGEFCLARLDPLGIAQGRQGQSGEQGSSVPGKQ